MARVKEVCVPAHIAGTSTQCRQSWHVSAITRPYVRPRAIFMEGCNIQSNLNKRYSVGEITHLAQPLHLSTNDRNTQTNGT